LKKKKKKKGILATYIESIFGRQSAGPRENGTVVWRKQTPRFETLVNFATTLK
jgi:hypothetical protein